MPPSYLYLPAPMPRRGSERGGYSNDSDAPLLHVVVTLINPQGVEVDITARLQGIGSLSETVEIELTELSHGDIDLDLDDFDGALEQLLADIDPTERWEVLIDRETGQRRPKYDRLFGGVLDLPWSLQYDRRERTTAMQVFSYSKLLERTSAEGVKRAIADKTATNVAGNTTCTVNTGGVTDLIVGDVVTIGYGDEEETREIVSIDVSGGNVFQVDEVWEFPHTALEMFVETPWYRWQSPEFLARLLFEEAGFPNPVLQLPLFDRPTPSGLNTTKLPDIVDDTPACVLQENSKLQWRYRGVAAVDGQYVADDFNGVYARLSGSPANYLAGDWSAYQYDEPASLITVNDASFPRDDGFKYAWDYSRGSYIELRVSGSNLDLYKDGIFVETINADGGHGTIPGNASIEWEPTQDEYWVSYGKSPGGDGNRSMLQYRAAGTPGAWTTQRSSTVSQAEKWRLRAMGPAGAMLCVALISTQTPRGGFVVDAATKSEINSDLEMPGGGLPWGAGFSTWQARTLGRFVVDEEPLYMVVPWNWTTPHDEFGTHIAVYDIRAGYKLLGTERISLRTSQTVFGFPLLPYSQCCVFRSSTAEDAVAAYCGIAGSDTFFAMGTKILAMPIADFQGKDCGSALKDIAIGTSAFVHLDRFGNAEMRPRNPVVAMQRPQPLPEPLEQMSLPLADVYRSTVIVTGKNESIKATNVDPDFTVVIGDGRKASALEIESTLITTESLGRAVGQMFADYVTKKRRGEEVTIPDTGIPWRVFDQVLLDNRQWIILEGELDVEGREQELLLVEVL